jgi:predicted dehydrogenase
LKTIRTAVVGVGHLGQHHARNLTEIPGSKLIGVVDADPKRAEEIGRKNGVPFFCDFHHLPEVDAVSIATPTVTHHDVASYFLNKKIHVLVEKPITDTLDQARELVALAEMNNVKFQVGHIERFNPAATAIDGMDLAPKFMEVHRLAPFSFRSVDVCVVKDLMIHDLDIIQHFAGSRVVDVHAVGFPVVTRKNDIANARLVFESGCVANVTASRLSLKPMRKFRIFSTNNYISLDYLNKTGVIIQASPKLMEAAMKIEDLDLTNAETSIFGDLLNIRQLEMDSYEPLKKELTAFLDCIRQDTEPVVTGLDGLRALELAERITESIEQHDFQMDRPQTVRG